MILIPCPDHAVLRDGFPCQTCGGAGVVADDGRRLGCNPIAHLLRQVVRVRP